MADVMEGFYWVLFGVLAAVVAVLVITQANQSGGGLVPSDGQAAAAFRRLRNNYTFVYALMMGEVLGGLALHQAQQL